MLHQRMRRLVRSHTCAPLHHCSANFVAHGAILAANKPLLNYHCKPPNSATIIGGRARMLLSALHRRVGQSLHLGSLRAPRRVANAIKLEGIHAKALHIEHKVVGALHARRCHIQDTW